MNDALALLRSDLARSFSQAAKNPDLWSDAKSMERAKERVIRDHGGAAIKVDGRTIWASIEDFRRLGRAKNFRELKYVCLGVSAMDSKGWCILAEDRLREQVGKQVEEQTAIHRKLRCFQALLASYFSFPLGASNLDPKAVAGWTTLRTWLQRQRQQLAAVLDHVPPWFEALNRHSELLTGRPCDKFVPDLMRGDASSLEEAMDSLAIDRDSWVMEAAVFAQMAAAAKFDDGRFKAALPDLLRIAMGEVGVRVGERLRIRCVALLISRYARCSATPEHPGLRDVAVSVIGNPWLRRASWDAHVVDATKLPDTRAREMLFGWLKGRLIQDFFELLSAEDAGDTRRLVYWLRFAPFVDDMWFALGPAAQCRNDRLFREFRERAKGRLLDLDGASGDNNAFVMRIGAYVAIEFGATGNAFYLLRWDVLPQAVSRALTSGHAKDYVALGQLKPELHEWKQSHRDAPTALRSWEQKFDDELLPRLGVALKERPACVPDLEVLLQGRNVVVADNRAKGGSLRIGPDEELVGVARQLSALGMLLRRGRGWVKE
ncbi:hypothetical protein CJO88_05770 [Ralstonia solanacearum]|nr:hypothetical protein CJO88_05770 [Ralstonia solanacearum]